MSSTSDLPSTPRRPSLLATVGEALAGSDQDFTEGPLGRAIVLLAIPMVLETVMESLFAVVDVFWVSRLGAEAVAVVGLTESLLMLVYALAMGLAMGATALVARRTGERNPAAAARGAGQAILVGLGAALLVGLVGSVLAPRWLGAMGGAPGTVAAGAGYARVMLGGSGTVILLYLMNAVFRGAGEPATAMRALWLANGLNMALAPCLIFGLGPFPVLGIEGAAIATTCGRGVGVLYQLYRLTRAGGRVALHRSHLAPDPPALASLARVALPGVLQVLVSTASWVVLVRLIARFGDAALAGYTIAIRVVLFALFPSWGLGNAAATLVGQSLGAQRPERAARAVWIAGLYNMAFLGAVSAGFLFFDAKIIGAFTSDRQVLRVGAECLRIVSYGFVFYGFGMVSEQAFNGAGDTRTPTWLNVVCYWLFEIPLAYGLAERAGLGPRGVFWSITASFSLSAVLGFALFRRGAWKRRAV